MFSSTQARWRHRGHIHRLQDPFQRCCSHLVCRFLILPTVRWTFLRSAVALQIKGCLWFCEALNREKQETPLKQDWQQQRWLFQTWNQCLHKCEQRHQVPCLKPRTHPFDGIWPFMRKKTWELLEQSSWIGCTLAACVFIESWSLWDFWSSSEESNSLLVT